MSNRSLTLPCLLAISLILSLGCNSKPDDSKISSDVQSKFSQDSGLSTKQLAVQANNGIVTLGGFVDNDAQRQAASRQAASVEGVKEVVNNLHVGKVGTSAASSARPAANVADAKSVRGNPTAGKSRRPPSLRNATADDSAAANTMAQASEAPPAPPPDAHPADPPPPAAPKLPTITIEQGTQISIRLIDSIDSEKNQVGDTFHASLSAPLMAAGAEAIAVGTDVSGHVVDLKSAGKFKGQSLVVLQLDTITANGNTYELQTDQYKKEGSSRGKNTAEKVGGGAVLGGIIGAIAGGGKGAAVGTAAGAGVGGGVQAAGKGQQIKLPSETILNFILQAPVTVIKPSDPNSGRQRLGDSQ